MTINNICSMPAPRSFENRKLCRSVELIDASLCNLNGTKNIGQCIYHDIFKVKNKIHRETEKVWHTLTFKNAYLYNNSSNCKLKTNVV